MSTITNNISQYIKDRGINVSKMSRELGIPYISLYNSLLNPSSERTLRDIEFMKICYFLDVDPRLFMEARNDIQGVKWKTKQR